MKQCTRFWKYNGKKIDMVSDLMEFKVQRKRWSNTAIRPCVKEGVVMNHMLWECRGRKVDLGF